MGQSIRHLLDEFPEITVQDFKVEKIDIATQSLVIDFSSPDYLSEILNTCVASKIATGHRDDRLKFKSP